MNIQGFLNLIWFSCLFPLLTDYFLQFKILCLPIGLYILFLSIIKLLVSKFLESHLSNSNKRIHKPSSRPHGIFSSHSKKIYTKYRFGDNLNHSSNPNIIPKNKQAKFIFLWWEDFCGGILCVWMEVTETSIRGCVIASLKQETRNQASLVPQW